MVLEVDQVGKDITDQGHFIAIRVGGRRDALDSKRDCLNLGPGQQWAQVVRDKDKLAGPALILVERAKDQGRVPQLLGRTRRFLPGGFALESPGADRSHLSKAPGKSRGAHSSAGCLKGLDRFSALRAELSQGCPYRKGIEQKDSQLVHSLSLAVGGHCCSPVPSQGAQHGHIIIYQETVQFVHKICSGTGQCPAGFTGLRTTVSDFSTGQRNAHEKPARCPRYLPKSLHQSIISPTRVEARLACALVRPVGTQGDET